MDFGAAAAAASHKIGGLSIFDDEGNASAVNAPPALQTRTRLSTAAASKSVNGCATDIQAPVPTQAGRKQPQKHELGYNSSGSGGGTLATTQKCNRTAKNGREQQRAQKISDVIDQLKVRLVSRTLWMCLAQPAYLLEALLVNGHTNTKPAL